MTDTKNTEVPPASEPPASVQQVPVAVRESRGWLRPLLAALIVVGALVVGGVGGFALAGAMHSGPHPVLDERPGMPGQGPGQEGPRAPRNDPDGGHPPMPDDHPGSDDSGDEAENG